MMNYLINNKAKLLEAIDSYDLLSATQKKLLSTLVSLEIDGEIILNRKSLANFAKISRPALYSSISFLKEQGFITEQKGIKKNSHFKLNDSRFEHVVEWYKKLKNFQE